MIYLLIYIGGVIFAYILGAIWNDYFIKWFKLDEGRWEVYPNSICLLSIVTVFIWFVMFILALLSKLILLTSNKPTFKRKH
jgi:biotin transporter BioY